MIPVLFRYFATFSGLDGLLGQALLPAADWRARNQSSIVFLKRLEKQRAICGVRRSSAKARAGQVRWLLAVGLLLLGCSPQRYRQAADRQVAAILAEKAREAPEFGANFSIKMLPVEAWEGLPQVERADDYLGEAGKLEVGAYRISLRKALALATKHNRNYQTQKEVVYLDALQLTLARYQFTPLFSGRGSSRYQETVREVAQGVDAVTEAERSVRLSGEGTAGFNQLLQGGARLATDFMTDFLRFITGDGSVVRSSRAAATLTQPLLRGRGYRVTMENLTQAERNVLYSLRDFIRFRQEFTVQVASAYYRVLLNREFARNAFLGLENFRQNVQEGRALFKEGRRSRSQLGQLEQAELSAESQWIHAVRNYKQSLDDFKVRQLGLSAGTPIVFDWQEVEGLSIVHPEIDLQGAIIIAETSRMDLHTAHDLVIDAARRVQVRSNGLLPDLDLALSGGLDSEPGKPLAFSWDRSQWDAGLHWELPFNRRSERNAYRASLIHFDQTVRQAQLRQDEIQLNVTETLRSLDQAKRQFAISEVGVELGRRRVEEENLRSELNLGTARDQVEAQTDFINALNQRTSALISHTIARLDFWSTLGILQISDTGNWIEPHNEG